MILHLTRKEKFTKPFIDFIKENFDISEHFFLLVGGQNKKEFYIEDDSYIKTISNKKDFLKYFIEFNKKMYKADKIIIHGLSQPYNIFYLFLNPWLLKKCYWVMWGGDFYFPEKQSWIKKQVIKNIPHCIPVTPDDYVYLKSNYNTKAKYNKCINYIRSLKLESSEIKQKISNTTKILIGNSATNTNRHLDVFNLIKNYKNVEIIVPLSYGDNEYAKNIIAQGEKLFENFTPLVDFMEYDKYHKLLENIDIAIFNHNRQQGVGNIILVLSMGKTLYISKENNAYSMLKDMGISFFDVNELKEGLKEITLEEKQKNKEIILENYNEQKATEEWRRIFEK